MARRSSTLGVTVVVLAALIAASMAWGTFKVDRSHLNGLDYVYGLMFVRVCV